MNTSGKNSFPGGARRPKGSVRESADTNRNTPERAHPRQTRKPVRFQRPVVPPHERPGHNAEPLSIPEHNSGRQAAPRTAGEQAPLLPGIKPVLEMLQNTPERVDAVFLRKGRHGSDMAAIVDACRAAGVRFSLLDPPSFARVYSGNSQGVVARLFEAGFVDLDELLDNVMDAPLPLVLALDQVQDPGNAGALARTLYALGGAGMIAPRHNGVYLGAAASKAAAGALERLPVAKAANLGQAVDSAKKLGFTIYGAAVAGSPEKVALPDNGPDAARKAALPILPVLDAYSASFRLPALLILGSEESGIRPGLEKRCDYLVSIPMLRDFDSLNVAQAGGIIVSCFARDVLAGRK
ncbi:MAG: RNA methyltransferase [Desulfovibrionaceae bacterium]|nr:RNA methyltransferase [Desulfovibrionaceae bacterium]